MSKRILLTISILISNRPDTVRKCLDSIQPLLKAVPSELILTDTGCGKEVRSIIEEYTNHIINFKWCNDFSKARNVGLKQAKGKWFLFLDDDEWFEDTTEMIEFFNSGEYKQYGMGAYYQRNFCNYEGTLYSDLLVGRMTQLTPEVKFEYSIHECFNLVVGKVKKFNTYVHHYGYVYNSPEERRAHGERNIPPLLKEHRANPRNMKHVLQLVQEYNVINEWDKSMEYSLEGIETAKKGGGLEESFCLSSLYANVVMLYMEKWRFEAAIQHGEEYLKLDVVDPMAKAVIAGKLADAYMRTERYEKSLEAAGFYWRVYQDFLKDEGSFLGYITNLTCSCFEAFNRSIALGNGVNAAVRLGKEETAWEWFQAMEIEKGPVYIEPDMAKDIAEKLPEASEEGRKHYTEMCNALLRQGEKKEFILDVIKVRCSQGANLEEKLKLAAAYRGCEADHNFLKFVKVADAFCRRQAGEDYDADEVEKITASFWENLDQNMSMMKECDIFELEERLGIDPAAMLKRIPYYVWQKELTTYYSRCSREDAAWWTERLSEYLPEEDMRMLLWRAFHGIYDAIKETGTEGGVSAEAVRKGVKEYAESRMQLCGQIYRPEILEESRDVLTEEDQAAYSLSELEQEIEREEYSKAVERVKKIKALLPGLNPVMKWYLTWISGKVEEQERREQQEQKKAMGEMQVLAVGIKLKIRQLVQAGNVQAALGAARQLSALMPQDEELTQQIKKLEAQLEE